MAMDNPAAAIAANRFGLGARPRELAAIGRDARGWLEQQLRGPAPLVEEAGLRPSFRILAQVLELRRDRKDDQAASQPSSTAPKPGQGDARPEVPVAAKLRELYRPIYLAESNSRLRQAVSTERSFIERLVQFWTNHFAVSADKPSVTGIAGAFEREAIRPHVLGRFSELLFAVEKHPAMLLYLDNHLSAGPNSEITRRGANNRRRLRRDNAQRGQPRGLNENLAREILELHTLGVGGGYTQADVTTFAKVITGWSVSGNPGPLGVRDPGKFEFRDTWHEPGAKTLLGKRYAEGGVGQGETVLRDLARHPSTAKFIATKLARHFVADEPPAALVDSLADAFRDSGGDLPAVYRTLLAHEAAWRAEPAKFKTPNDYIVSTYRALDLPVEDQPRTFASFDLLGQRPWTPGSPAGWPDRAADWDGAAAIFKRIEWADAVASRVGSKRSAAELAPQVLGASLTERTRTAIARAESGAQALTLLLSSPEFMRR
jgi:uncharacterized protein (DUF1800 family)